MAALACLTIVLSITFPGPWLNPWTITALMLEGSAFMILVERIARKAGSRSEIWRQLTPLLLILVGSFGYAMINSLASLYWWRVGASREAFIAQAKLDRLSDVGGSRIKWIGWIPTYGVRRMGDKLHYKAYVGFLSAYGICVDLADTNQPRQIATWSPVELPAPLTVVVYHDEV